MSVTEKVSYLKGLAEGLGVDDSTKEGKLLRAIVEVLNDVSESLDSLEDFTNELSEQVDAIDEDLDMLESDYYDEWDEDDDDACHCGDDEEFYDVTCPHCNEEFSVDEDTVMSGSVDCPHCGEKVEFDIDECDCGDDCCGCHADEDEDDKH